MHPDFKSNLKHTFSETLGSAGYPEVTTFLSFLEASKEFHTVLSTMHAYQRTWLIYSLYCVFVIDADL